jgi:hypothetical protein
MIAIIGGTPSAGLFQTADYRDHDRSTAGLKQPSSRCVKGQNLGRRNAALVQGTELDLAPKSASGCTLKSSRTQASQREQISDRAWQIRGVVFLLARRGRAS